LKTGLGEAKAFTVETIVSAGRRATQHGESAVTDPNKTCAACGNTQATGNFCKTCGAPLSAATTWAGGASEGPPVGAAPATAAPAAGAPPAAPAPPAPAAQPAPTSAPHVPQSSFVPPSPPVPPRDYPRGRNFWSRFFNLSFEEFITPSLVKALFIIAMIVIGLGVLGAIVMGFVSAGALGIFVLIGAVIAGFIYLLLARVFLEMVVIFFRIRDNTEEIASKKR